MLFRSSINIPDSVTSIGDCAFYNCYSLKNIVLPERIERIGSGAFEYCRSIKEVHISDIAAWCAIDFEGVYANPLYFGATLYLNGELVTSLEIPDSVTSIGDYAFIGCGSLESITFQGSMKQWKAIDKESSWNYDTGSFTITCTDGVLDKYDNQI